MATLKEIFESPVYRQLTQEPQEIPWACFKTVYDALEEALQMLDKQSEKVDSNAWQANLNKCTICGKKWEQCFCLRSVWR